MLSAKAVAATPSALATSVPHFELWMLWLVGLAAAVAIVRGLRRLPRLTRIGFVAGIVTRLVPVGMAISLLGLAFDCANLSSLGPSGESRCPADPRAAGYLTLAIGGALLTMAAIYVVGATYRETRSGPGKSRSLKPHLE